MLQKSWTLLSSRSNSSCVTRLSPGRETDQGWHCCIQLFERRRWLCDYGRLVVPPAASQSDCSRDDDGAGKKDTHGLAPPTFLQNCTLTIFRLAECHRKATSNRENVLSTRNPLPLARIELDGSMRGIFPLSVLAWTGPATLRRGFFIGQVVISAGSAKSEGLK